MKKLRFLLTVIILAMLLCGCAIMGTVDDDGQTNIILKNDNSVIYRIREGFGETYYSIDELKNMILDEAATYNSNHNTGDVGINKVEAVNGVTNVEMSFINPETFSEFNGAELFVGSYAEAVQKGLVSKLILTSVGDTNQTIADSDMKNMNDCLLLVYGGKERIYLPSRALYISDSCRVSQEGMSVSSDTDIDDLIYVLFK